MPYTIAELNTQKQSRKKNGKKVKTKKQSKKELNDQWVRCFRCNPWNGECKKCKKNKNYYVKK